MKKELNILVACSGLYKNGTFVKYFSKISKTLSKFVKDWANKSITKNLYFANMSYNHDRDWKAPADYKIIENSQFEPMIDFMSRFDELKFDVIISTECINLTTLFNFTLCATNRNFFKDEIYKFYRSLNDSCYLFILYPRSGVASFVDFKYFFTLTFHDFDHHLFLVQVLDGMFSKLDDGVYQYNNLSKTHLNNIINNAWNDIPNALQNNIDFALEKIHNFYGSSFAEYERSINELHLNEHLRNKCNYVKPFIDLIDILIKYGALKGLDQLIYLVKTNDTEIYKQIIDYIIDKFDVIESMKKYLKYKTKYLKLKESLAYKHK